MDVTISVTEDKAARNRSQSIVRRYFFIPGFEAGSGDLKKNLVSSREFLKVSLAAAAVTAQQIKAPGSIIRALYSIPVIP